jgi:hypothetical protein
MDYTYENLHAMTVAQLREIAQGSADQEALRGYSTMHKEDLLLALCATLGIEAHPHHEVVGIDKSKIKAQIRELKKQRQTAEAAGDKTALRRVRRRIHRLKRSIRRATV